MPSTPLSELDLSDLRHFERGIPHALFARLRREAPLHFSTARDGGFWSLTRWEDVAAVNRDGRAFSSGSRSVSTPVSARTSEVFPWSM